MKHADMMLHCPRSTLQSFFVNPVNRKCETRLLAATGYETFTGLSLQHWTLKERLTKEDN